MSWSGAFARAIEPLLLAVDIDLDGLGEDAVDRLIFFGALGADGHLFGFIEGLDDVLAAVEAEARRTSCRECAFCGRSCVDELFLLIDLELEPGAA